MLVVRYWRQRLMAKLPNTCILTNVQFNIKFKVLFYVYSFLFCTLVIYHSTLNQSILVLFGDTSVECNNEWARCKVFCRSIPPRKVTVINKWYSHTKFLSIRLPRNRNSSPPTTNLQIKFNGNTHEVMLLTRSICFCSWTTHT